MKTKSSILSENVIAVLQMLEEDIAYKVKSSRDTLQRNEKQAKFLENVAFAYDSRCPTTGSKPDTIAQ